MAKKHYSVRYWFRGGFRDRYTMAVSEKQAINNVKFRLIREGRYVGDMQFEAREMGGLERE